MNPTQEKYLQHGPSDYEQSRSTYNEDKLKIMELSNKVQRLERKVEWMRQQVLTRQHEEYKRQKILDWERKHTKAIKSHKTYDSSHSRSKSSSKSPSYHQERYKEKSMSYASKSDTMFRKLNESTSMAVPLFNHPEGPSISNTGLRGFKDGIHRNISTKDINYRTNQLPNNDI